MKAYNLGRLIYACSDIIKLLPKHEVVRLHSCGRGYFLSSFYSSKVEPQFIPGKSCQRTLWGLKFASPLMNSAGMFKNGEGYDVVYRQGAGGYIAGTSTYNPRVGNIVDSIRLPFISLHKSQTSINYLGLPNLGDEVLSQNMFAHDKQIPIGVSLMRSGDYDEKTGMQNLLKSLWLYHNHPQVDFIEINESCPNVKLDLSDIIQRLAYLGENFLAKRKRHLPVIIKFSLDIGEDDLKLIMDTLIKYNFDGLNLGNTSTNYADIRPHIASSEVKLFDYFTSKFGGGVGGNILKQKSYNCCKKAVEYKRALSPRYEFHIIRSAGIDCADDLLASDTIGVSLNQWYTGYFTNYIKYGDLVYQRMLEI